MPYIGNNPQTQSFTPAIDYFNGDGTTVTFTLSRPLVSTAQVIAVIENVPQNPSTAFSVSGNSITFTSAPPSGTNNIWVEYTSLITTYNAISQDPSVIGDITATGGFLAVGDFGNTYTDGTIVDYVTGMARITTGPADGLTIYNGGTTARTALTTWTADGNVGIGTTSPTNFGSNFRLMEVKGTDYGVIQATSTSGSTTIEMMGASGTGYLSTRTNHPLVFRTNDTERARIATNGDFLVGTTSYSASTDGSVMGAAGIANTSNNGFNFVCNKASGAAQGAYIVFFWGGGLTGYINYNGAGGITFNSASDARLKENIVDSVGGLETLNKIKVREFDWKESKAHEPYGFIAQELHEVYPSAVTAQKDKEDGSMDMPWAVDYGRLTPMLVKAVQEQQAIIEDLKARIETLEAK